MHKQQWESEHRKALFIEDLVIAANEDFLAILVHLSGSNPDISRGYDWFVTTQH